MPSKARRRADRQVVRGRCARALVPKGKLTAKPQHL